MSNRQTVGMVVTGLGEKIIVVSEGRNLPIEIGKSNIEIATQNTKMQRREGEVTRDGTVVVVNPIILKFMESIKNKETKEKE